MCVRDIVRATISRCSHLIFVSIIVVVVVVIVALFLAKATKMVFMIAQTRYAFIE